LHITTLSNPHLKNFPLSSLSAATANRAITFPGFSGFRVLPVACRSPNFFVSLASMTAALPRTSRCISVSTTPGRTATLVMSGSSAASVRARWFRAALEEP
jgi:hypothetical protein